MAQILEIDKVQSEASTYKEPTVFKRTYKEAKLRKYYPENENLTADSKSLTFEIQNIPGQAYHPYETTLHLPVKITDADGTNYSNPGAPNATTPTEHARFKNFVGLHIIKDVKVYPSNGPNVEHLKPEHTQCIETMRYYLQQTVDEKRTRIFHRIVGS